MKPLQKLVWSEGMFLSPQHFQALDHYYEALLEARLGATSPLSWGVTTLEIDGAALAAGQLRVQRFGGIFPDGLAVTFADTDAEAPAPRSVQERFPPTARSLEVFLAVRREREGIPSYADGRTEGSPARYAVTSRAVHDATRAGGLVDVSFARARTALLLGDEAREDYEVIQIAELVRTGSGGLALSDTFVPPVLRLQAAPKLAAAIRDLLVRLVAKHRELADGRRHRDGGGGAEVSGPELARLLQIFALGEAVPVLADLVEGQGGSPLSAYGVLVKLAGQLATFTPEADVAGLPKYVPTDLRSTFDPLLARLNAFVGGLAVERFTRVPLEVRGPLQIARLQDDRVARASQLYLSVKSDIPEAQVAEQLPRLCKIAALTEIQSLVQAAAPGVPLQLMHRPPPEIPVRPGVLCFQIAQGDRLWKNVITDRNLAFYLPPPFDPSRTRVELLAVPQAGTPGAVAS